jgi:sugar/nucleoside kinase (ribokinase family)
LLAYYGLKWDLKSSAVFASATAALSCTEAGARRGLPTLDEVKAYLDSQGFFLECLINE